MSKGEKIITFILVLVVLFLVGVTSYYLGFLAGNSEKVETLTFTPLPKAKPAVSTKSAQPLPVATTSTPKTSVPSY